MAEGIRLGFSQAWRGQDPLGIGNHERPWDGHEPSQEEREARRWPVERGSKSVAWRSLQGGKCVCGGLGGWTVWAGSKGSAAHVLG